MSKNGGLGAVLSKNNTIVSDTLERGKITAVKHGNGRDWWIGQAVFSPDGSKFVYNNLIGGLSTPDMLSIYDFDRCIGELSNPIQFLYGDSAWYGGVAISPNSRFIYVPHHLNVYQFDLEADDILASIDTVAVYDGFFAEITPTFLLPTPFFVAELAPDGKIYINCPTAVQYLHVINQPNEKGAACDLVQHGVKLPTLNVRSLPNFPNYRLSALEGSPCDTIVPVVTVETSLKTGDFHVYPNPANNNFYVEWEDLYIKNGKLVLLNLYGQILSEYTIPDNENPFYFSASNLEAGTYFVKILDRDKVVHSEKIILIK